MKTQMLASVIIVSFLVLWPSSLSQPPTAMRPMVSEAPSQTLADDELAASGLASPSTSVRSYSFGGVVDSQDWPTQVGVVISNGSVELAGFNYGDFGTAAGLSFVGSAAQHADRLRLTSSDYYQTGAVWATAPQPVLLGFRTQFTFQITEKLNGGADGFAFVLQNTGPLALGSGGGSVGYSLLDNSIAIEFDTYANTEIADPNGNHVSVQTRRSEPNDANPVYSLGTTSDIPDLSDGRLHQASIVYEPGELRVYVDSATPQLVVPVDLEQVLALSEGKCWVGFTATTGACSENHEIADWSFAPDVAENRVRSAFEDVVVQVDSVDQGWNNVDRMVGVSTKAMQAPAAIRLGSASDYGRGRFTENHTVHSNPTASSMQLIATDDYAECCALSDSLVPEPILAQRKALLSHTAMVTSPADSGQGTLRSVLSDADAGTVVRFDPVVFPSSSPVTIELQSPLPDIVQGNIIVDASSAGVILDGQGLAWGNGLRLASDGNVIKGLKIIRFPEDGIHLVAGSSHNQIGGDWQLGDGPRGEGNIITLNRSDGIEISGIGTMSNTVLGNLIGLDLDIGDYPTQDFRVQALVVSPSYDQDQTLFVATPYDGVWKSTDAGETWEATSVGLTDLSMQVLEISPAYGSDQTIFAGTSTGEIFKTPNGGDSWERVDNGKTTQRKVQSIALSPHYDADQEVMVVDDDLGLLRSADGGTSWASWNSGMEDDRWNLNSLAFSPDYATDQTLFAKSWSGLFKSVNGGNEWAQVVTGTTNLAALALSPDYSSDQTLLLGFDHCDPMARPAFWKSVDGGDHWTPITGTLGMCGIRVLRFVPSTTVTKTIFAGDSWGGIYRSTDTGESWERVRASRYNWTIGVSPAYAQDHTIFVGQNSGEILRSQDGGTTWGYVGTYLTELGNNDDGVRITSGAQYNSIGGRTVADRNVISNNGIRGVFVEGADTLHNRITGNYIGTAVSGLEPLGNDTEGVVIENAANNNTLDRNVIAANVNAGVIVRHTGTSGNTLTGNYVGLGADGRRALGNRAQGVVFSLGASYNVLGGSDPSDANVISRNGEHGVGVLDLNTDNNVIAHNYIGVDLDGTIPLGNYAHGVNLGGDERGGPRFNRVDSNVISANGAHGVGIGFSSDNIVVGNLIGVEANGQSGLGNLSSGVGIYGHAQGNQIGGTSAAERNIISGNQWGGIDIWDTQAVSNVITGNYIGTDVTGSTGIGNEGAGIGIWAARFNRVGGIQDNERNVISGNGGDGVSIWNTDTVSNTVSGNYIGLDASGSSALGNGDSGVELGSGAAYNRIGGAMPGEQNTIAGNVSHGISIWGPDADHNEIVGNLIGLASDGSTALPNTVHGIVVSDAADNRIGGSVAGERNVVSGNGEHGIQIWGSDATSNNVIGNYVGLDATGTISIGNGLAGIVIGGGAQQNRIGGTLPGERNIVSGNAEHGVGIWDVGTDHNRVIANFIGTDVTGKSSIGNGGSGLVISNRAQFNTVGGEAMEEGNVISGNGGHGVGVWDEGTTHNTVSGNLIGVDFLGTDVVRNGASGISLGGGAQFNQIGSYGSEGRNVISGNHWDGVGIWGALTAKNVVIGNYIGVDKSGMRSLESYSCGVGIRDGASHNTIGGTEHVARNLISGHDDAGVCLVGAETQENAISGNFIGVDVTGKVPLGNRYGVSCLLGAHHNTVDHNVIGNSIYSGVRFDSCDDNRILYNGIGTDLAGQVDLGNGMDGVNLFNAAQNNEVGPGNLVAYNQRRGVSIWDSTSLGNRVTGNAIYGNLSRSIVLGDKANAALQSPTLDSATAQLVHGTVPVGVVAVEIYSGRVGDAHVYEGVVTPVRDGAFEYVSSDAQHGPYVMAIGIDADGNASALSSGLEIGTLTCLPETRYEHLRQAAMDSYPSNRQLRIQALVDALDREWEQSGGLIGLEWSASPMSSTIRNFGYQSIVWTATEGYPPIPDPVGTWSLDSDFYQNGWGVYRASGSERMHSPGRSARICVPADPLPLSRIDLTGPTSGVVGTALPFHAVAAPLSSTIPITYTWQINDRSVEQTGKWSDDAAFYWSFPGPKTLTVTATNGESAVEDSLTLSISESPPLDVMGYATSVPVSPEELVAWNRLEFEGEIPPGTEVLASILTRNGGVVPGFEALPVNAPVGQIDLSSIDPAIYSSLAVRLDLLSTVPTLSPRLWSWRLVADVSEAGDDYEPDNACEQASLIATNGAVQTHSFHELADQDWVAFYAQAGVIYSIEAQIPVDSSVDVALELYDRCGSLPGALQNHAFAPGVRLDYRSPINGPIYLKWTNHDPTVFGSVETYDLSVRAWEQESMAGAVVIVAGRLKLYDPVQGNINYVADQVYELFRDHGYNDDRILYLSTDLTTRGVDGSPTVDSLREAITLWAKDKVGPNLPLTLYLVDHGGNNRLYLDKVNGQWIQPGQLNAWLNELELSVPGTSVNVIIEACYSGSFVTLPKTVSKADRVVIASTSDADLAWTSQLGAVFSDHLLAGLDLGKSLYGAFREARWATRSVSSNQSPWLDDDGDSVANGDSDGSLAATRGFSYPGTMPNDSWPPYIAEVSQSVVVSEGFGTLEAHVLDDESVRRVWVVVHPPSYQMPESNEELVQEALPTAVLPSLGNDQYAVSYPGFHEPGEYRLVFHAEDNDGREARPVSVMMHVGSAIYLPILVLEN